MKNKFKVNFGKIKLPPVRPTPPLRRGDLRSVKRACKVWPRNSVSSSSFTALKKWKYLFSCTYILNGHTDRLISIQIIQWCKIIKVPCFFMAIRQTCHLFWNMFCENRYIVFKESDNMLDCKKYRIHTLWIK